MNRIILKLVDIDQNPFIGKWAVSIHDVNKIPIKKIYYGQVERSEMNFNLPIILFEKGEHYTFLIEAANSRSTWFIVGASTFKDNEFYTKKIMVIPINFKYKLEELAYINVWNKIKSLGLNKFFLSVIERKVDRVYFKTSPELKHQLGWGWGRSPGHGDRFPFSWKSTKFPMGNLQLSLNEAFTECDADIDLARGIGHAGEVLHNHLLNKTTDQLDVYCILFNQGIELPGLNTINWDNT